jgi:hypothetical protein
VIHKVSSPASAGDERFHPTDQRSFDMGHQAGEPSGYAGRQIANGVSSYQACLNAQMSVMAFADDPVLAGSMTGQDGSPANSADYLQGCLVAVGYPGVPGE